MSGLMILVAGPYRSGTGGDPARIQANVDAMTTTALDLFRRGHLPVMGEWFALPLIEAATAAGDVDADEAIFHPIAEAVLARCDGCLRIGGPSEGADRMVATARRLGKAVWTSIDDVPAPSSAVDIQAGRQYRRMPEHLVLATSPGDAFERRHELPLLGTSPEPAIRLDSRVPADVASAPCSERG